MPSSDSAEKRSLTVTGGGAISTTHPPHKPNEPLPCPRCDSISTKFCYYNNYNLAQPRYFCKGCRRYWTHGGSLRNIPVGGGSRKNSKRSSRSATSTSSTTTANSSSSTITSASALVNDHQYESVSMPVSANPDSGLPVSKADINNVPDHGLNMQPLKENGNFLSLLTSQGPGFMGLGGYGSGFGYVPLGFELGGRGVWPYPGMGDINGGAMGGGGGGSTGYNTWQLGVGDVEENGTTTTTGVGLVDGDYFTWPSLAISTLGKGLK
ncbi:hypothetical protein Tsubulata_007433 [Turnera subulata]|uniref:Dof zinc finger protein n=1 Tax=Turnera subulata TaxID=218843 RepID=A0A9Q0F3L5_9ROSI|nr:hypothetical protein Tsubulata_007433 [Turnera subulata]